MKLPSELPKELSTLWELNEASLNDVSTIQLNVYSTATSDAVRYLQKRYTELYKSQKEYTQVHIAEQIFVDEIPSDQSDNYIRCSWQAISACLKERAERISEINTSGTVDAAYLLSELKFVRDLLLDLFMFLGRVENFKDNSHSGYGFGKRGLANSTEVFLASIDHLHYRLSFETFSSFFHQPMSVFLVRQSIELRIKNALGVVFIKKGDEILKITPDFFIDFLFEQPEIKCPISKSLVRKIHSWTNYFIHGGFFEPTWEIWLAHQILKPLFAPGRTESGAWSMYGAIEIEKSYYESKLDDELKRYICSRQRKIGAVPTDLYIQKISPEALLV